MKFGYHKIIIAGTRTFNDYTVMRKYVDFYLKTMKKSETILVSGCASGPDTFCIWYADTFGYEKRKFPPQYKHYGKIAPNIRNEEMSLYSTHLIAFWDYESTGTKDMIKRAEKHKLEVRIVDIRKYNTQS